MGAMQNLWSDPVFLDSIQKKQAAGEATAGADDSTQAESAEASPTPTSLSMRKDGDAQPKTPNLRLSDQQIANIPHKEPPKCVTRAEVEKALKKFLEDLATAQKSKHNAVRSSDKVWQADAALHQGLTDDASGPITPKGGDGKDYDADELAAKIAGQLPDTIPIENFNRFLKLKPTDTVLPGSTTDQIRKKYEEKRDSIAAKITQKFGETAGKLAKKAMDAAVEKGVGFVADQALKGAGVPADAQDEMKKAVDDYVKKATGDNSGDSDGE